MPWRVEFDRNAARDLRKLDAQAQRQILRYLRERIATDDNPRRFGHALTDDLKGFWRYRVSNYRIVASIEDARFVEFTDNGRRTFYATYTAYSGRAIRSELLETTDFMTFRMTPRVSTISLA